MEGDLCEWISSGVEICFHILYFSETAAWNYFILCMHVNLVIVYESIVSVRADFWPGGPRNHPNRSHTPTTMTATNTTRRMRALTWHRTQRTMWYVHRYWSLNQHPNEALSDSITGYVLREYIYNSRYGSLCHPRCSLYWLIDWWI